MRVAFLGILGMATAVGAHPGPRIWVSINSRKVTTFAGPYPPGAPQNYHVSRVFAQPLVDFGDEIWETDFPGFQKVPGGSISTGTTFRYDIVGPLLWFVTDDPTSCPYFESVAEAFSKLPPVPQMAVTNELLQTKYTASGFVAGDAAYTFHGSDGDHNHLSYTLLGDGANPGGGRDGIYALPLQLSAPGLTPSDPFFLVLGKNVSAGNFAEGMEVLLEPRIPPDLDCDGDVDLADFALFRVCGRGPSTPLPQAMTGLEHCGRADLDGDLDADLEDFGVFQNCHRGSGVSADASCMP